MDVNVVKATIDDFESISRLWKELDVSQVDIAPDKVKHFVGSARSRDVIERWITGDDRVMYLAIRDETAVGFTNLHVVDVEDKNMLIGRRYAHLSNIYVTTSCRGNGIAKLLMRKATEWSLEHGAAKIELQVYSKNVAANAMYADLGFQPFMQKLEFNLQNFDS